MNFKRISGQSEGRSRRHSWRRPRTRRSGMVVVYLALGLTVFLGICAIVVDEGYWLTKKADMQKAADAAVMVGGGQFAQTTSNLASTAAANANTVAISNAGTNGFVNGQNSVTVTTTTDFAQDHFTVTIATPARTFFGAIFRRQSVNISCSAVALFSYKTTPASFSITGQNYGLNTGPINIGMYGPEQVSERGDRYGTKYKLSGSSVILNPDYKSTGYDFEVTVPSTFGTSAIVQIYDPDSYDSGADSTASSKVWDEGGKDIYGPSGAGYAETGTGGKETFTKYTLYSDNGTPYDTSDDTQIATKTIGADSTKDKKWDNTFTFNPQTYKASNSAVQFRLNATTTSGANENGFNLRVAKPTDTDATFSGGGNGSDITGIGSLPVNFGVTGVGDVILGYVPTGATKVIVNHFDSDVGVTAGTYINYTYVNGSGTSSTMHGSALLGGSANDVLETDTLTLGNSYAGGTWHAGYSAGASDNTTWDLNYEGTGTSGSPGTIRLIY